MTYFPISMARANGYLRWAGKLWRSFPTRTSERYERRRLNEALRDLSAAQLRDIGFVRDDAGSSGNSTGTEDPRERTTIIQMT